MPRVLLSFTLSSTAFAAVLGLVTVVLAGCGGPDLPDVIPDESVGSCVYENRFADSEECVEYLGSDWTEDSAAAACAEAEGAFSATARCDYAAQLGTCLTGGEGDLIRYFFPGEDEADCSIARQGCEIFAGGAFTAGGTCGGFDFDTGGGIGTGGSVFIPESETCVDDDDGEEVCTRNMISACTEEGKKFNEFGSCENVVTQRPYWGAPPAPSYEEGKTDDPRLDDADWVRERDWVRDQLESCACICCHSKEISPDGPGNWFTEDPLWPDTFYATGLAMNAGWVDSSAFGAYPADENNGFTREGLGAPSTDKDRMVAFFEGELQRRGYTQDDFADMKPYGGPLYDQLVYVPSACEEGQRVDRDGTMHWTGGPARYVYILEADAANPGAPPNLDVPDGTLWHFRMDPGLDAVLSGEVVYGERPVDALQRVPADGGDAPALVEGQEYLLYVMADIALPVSRCTFTY